MGEYNAQMDPAAAQNVLFQDVYLPAFAEKCAELGVQFSDESSLSAALETVSMLKQASQKSSGNVVKAAHAALCEASGIATPVQRAAAEKQSADATKVASAGRIQQALASLATSQ